MNKTQEEIRKKVEKQTTITINYGNWRRLQLLKIHGNYVSIDDVISMLLNLNEAKK